MKNIAYIFPGQGSQSIGMLQSFANEQIVAQTLHQASECLKENIVDIIAHGPAEKINSTLYTQPIMLASSVAIYKFFRSKFDLLPSLMAGHSLGEYSALVVADVISFEDALQLVQFRAKAMQSAVAKDIGSMAAIVGAEYSMILDICNKISMEDNVVQIANINSKEQIVIAGHIKAVEQACIELKECGAKKCIMLPVSAPFHCSLLKPAELELSKYIQNIKFNKPNLNIVNNVDVKICNNPEDIKKSLVRQVSRPVRWVETIEYMQSQDINIYIEIGVGKVLQGLVKRIATNNPAIYGTDSLSSLEKTIEEIHMIYNNQ